MRNVFTKLAIVAGASLALAACGGSETANTTENATEMNSMDAMEGTTNDMTAVDGADNGAMAMDNGSMGMDNGAMGADNGGMAMDNASNAM